MQILWLSHLIPYPPKGGVLQRAYHLLKGLASYHDVDLLAFNQMDVMKSLYSDPHQGIAEAYEALQSFCRIVEFVEIESMDNIFGQYGLALKSLVTRDPYTINWLKSDAYTDALKRHIQKNSYGLVHFDTVSLVPYLKHIRNIPVTLDHHNIESHMLLRRAENEDGWLKKYYFRQEGKRLERVERILCPEFNANITCSDMDADRLKGIAGDCRVKVVPNPVDTEFFSPDTTVRQERSLLFVGSLGWYPNIKAVLFIANELWPRLKSVAPDVAFDIVGGGPPEEIVQLGKEDPNFRVHGFVDDILPFFDKAALYICPITDGGGTKLKILDALSMQKAIIADPIACEGIQVESGETVIFAQTVEEYLDTILKLLDDEDARLTMGVKARVLVERDYSCRVVAERLSRICVDTVNRLDA